jgi:hypothetical protein
VVREYRGEEEGIEAGRMRGEKGVQGWFWGTERS